MPRLIATTLFCFVRLTLAQTTPNPIVSLVPLYPVDAGKLPGSVPGSVFLTRAGGYLISYPQPIDPVLPTASARVEFPIVFPHQINCKVSTSIHRHDESQVDYRITVTSFSAPNKTARMTVQMPNAEAARSIRLVPSGSAASMEARVPQGSSIYELRFADGSGSGPTVTGLLRSGLLPGLGMVALSGNRIVDEQRLNNAPPAVRAELERLERSGFGAKYAYAIVPMYHPKTHPVAVAARFVQEINMAMLTGDLSQQSEFVNELRSKLGAYLAAAQSTSQRYLEEIEGRPNFIIHAKPLGNLEVSLLRALEVSLLGR
jgi:hypothetical protein